MKKVLNKIKNELNSMSIKKKLISMYIIVVLIPVLIVGIYFTDATRDMVINKALDEASTNTDRIEDRLNEALRIANDVSDRAYFNVKLENIVSKKYTDFGEVVNTYSENPIFDEYLRAYKEIESIRFYVNNETMLDNSQYIKVTDEIKKAIWYKEAVESKGKISWIYKQDDISMNKYLCLVRAVVGSNNKKLLGVLVINMSNNVLSNIIKEEPYETIISTDSGTIVMSKNNELIGTVEKILADENVTKGRKNIVTRAAYNGKDEYVIRNSFYPEKTLKNTLEIYNIVPIEKITNKTNEIGLRGISIILISLVVSFILIIIFSKSFSGRIIKLRREMHRVVLGDFNIKKTIDGRDEIGELYEDLYIMMESIKKLIDEVYIEKIQKEKFKNKQKEVQFKMLASQINPHFLYNTLETIRMKAYCSGEKEIAKIVKMLGKIMRRNLEVSEKMVTLQSEVELIESYLEIQKLRFGDKVEYCIDVKFDISNYEILPLVLQPIVENAFIHGLENKKGPGKITVVIDKVQNQVVIDVKDDGLGIDDERLKYVNNKLDNFHNDEGKSIGISNVNQRIKLYYGESYGIKMFSQLNEGTIVKITLPGSGGGFENVKSANS